MIVADQQFAAWAPKSLSTNCLLGTKDIVEHSCANAEFN